MKERPALSRLCPSLPRTTRCRGGLSSPSYMLACGRCLHLPGDHAEGWSNSLRQISMYVWIFDFTRLLPVLHCEFDVQQFKSHPADFGVPIALRKWIFFQMGHFLSYICENITIFWNCCTNYVISYWNRQVSVAVRGTLWCIEATSELMLERRYWWHEMTTK